MRHLDTDTVVALLRGNAGVSARLKAVGPEVAISTLVLAELRYGVHVARNPAEARRRLDRLSLSLQLVTFDDSAAEAYGRVRVSLRKRGLPIGDIDTLIAAAALSRGAVLVTHNTRHFSNVEGLIIEDWLG